MAFKNILLIKPSINKGCGTIVDPITIGLEYIASYIQNHVNKIDIIDLAKDSKSLEYHLKRLKPDLVGISAQWTIYHNESLEIAKKAKNLGSNVVVGGYHATGLSEELAANPNVDFVIRGEGEETMLELVQKGSAEGVRGISHRKDGKVVHNEDRALIKDLDSIPYPARHLRRYRYGERFFGRELDVIMTSRGCWGKCKFCCEYMMCKGLQRYRKPENIMKEIEYILDFHKGKELLIYIVDPNFGGNPNIAEDLCDRLIEFKSINNFEFNFIATSRVDIMSHHKILIKKMVQAGIDKILLGIESPQNDHLELMNKFTTKDMQEKAISNIHHYNGTILGSFCIGFPFENIQDIQLFYEYAKRLKIDYPLFGIVTPFPGTTLFEELKANNLIVEKDWDKYDYFNPIFKHNFLSNDQLRTLFLRIWINSYNDLTINSEFNEHLNRKKKKKLYAFAIKLSALFNFVKIFSKNEDIANLNTYLRDFINPSLKLLTIYNKLNNVFEMSRFLKILGKQNIQITLKFKNEPIISWVIKTNHKEVEYIDSIPGAINDASIFINLYTDNIIAIKYFKPIEIANLLLKDLLKDNKGLKAKFNLIRLFFAIALEYISYKLDDFMSTFNFTLFHKSKIGKI